MPLIPRRLRGLHRHARLVRQAAQGGRRQGAQPLQRKRGRPGRARHGERPPLPAQGLPRQVQRGLDEEARPLPALVRVVRAGAPTPLAPRCSRPRQPTAGTRSGGGRCSRSRAPSGTTGRGSRRRSTSSRSGRRRSYQGWFNSAIGNSVASITDMITDIRLVAYMDNEHHTIRLACFRGGWSFNMGPSRRLSERIKAAARLFAQTNKVEHREQGEIPWIGNSPSFDHGHWKPKCPCILKSSRNATTQ